MKWLRRFWFSWWDIIESYRLGTVVRPRGTKILFVCANLHQERALLCGYASMRGELESGRIWYVRAGTSLEYVHVVYLADRGVTWVYGWDGPDAEALRATHLLTESAR